MHELFYKEDRVTPLFETALDKKRADDSGAIERKLSNWRNDFIKTFCSHEAGRRVLWFLVHETYVFRNFGQHNAGAYALEGKRELGQEILNMIGHEEVLKSLAAVKAAETKEAKDV